MANVEINKGSPLNFSRLLELDGILFWDSFDFPDVPLSDQDTYINLTENQARRVDLIAFDNYNDSDLMWVILLANSKELPNQFVEGERIRIPAISTVNEIIRLLSDQ